MSKFFNVCKEEDTFICTISEGKMNYFEDNFEEGTKKSVSLCVKNLIAAFKELVGESTWMAE